MFEKMYFYDFSCFFFKKQRFEIGELELTGEVPCQVQCLDEASVSCTRITTNTTNSAIKILQAILCPFV